MDKMLFFQEVTKRLCGTLHLDTALERCFVCASTCWRQNFTP